MSQEVDIGIIKDVFIAEEEYPNISLLKKVINYSRNLIKKVSLSENGVVKNDIGKLVKLWDKILSITLDPFLKKQLKTVRTGVFIALLGVPQLTNAQSLPDTIIKQYKFYNIFNPANISDVKFPNILDLTPLIEGGTGDFELNENYDFTKVSEDDIKFAFKSKEKYSYGVEEDVSRVVECVFQDDNGFLWIGTQNNLLMCDANGIMKSFTFGEDLIHVKNIKVVDGYIIVTSNRGTYSLNTTTFQFEIVGENNDVKSDVLFSEGNNLWIGENKDGKYLISHLVKQDDGFLLDSTIEFPQEVECMYEDTINTNILWIGTPKGLFSLDKISKEINTHLDDYHVYSIYIDSDGILYCGVKHGEREFITFDPSNDEIKEYMLEGGEISDIIEYEGFIILASENGVVVMSKNGSIITEYAMLGVSSISIKDDILLIGGNKGLSVIDLKPHLQYFLEDYDVRYVCDGKDFEWVATTSGLLKSRKNDIQKHYYENVKIHYVYPYKDDKFLFVCTSKGVSIFDVESEKIIYLTTSIVNKDGETVDVGIDSRNVVEKNGKIYILSNYGVWIFDENTNTINQLQNANIENMNNVELFCGIQKGNTIWGGTLSGEIVEINTDNDNVECSQYIDGKIYSIDVEGDDLLVGTAKGLYRFFIDTKQIEQVTLKVSKNMQSVMTQDLIRDDVYIGKVYSVAVEDSGVMYLGTPIGVMKVSKDGEVIEIYNQNYNIPFSDIWPSVFKDESGDIYFFTPEGYISIDSKNSNNYVPTLDINCESNDVMLKNNKFFVSKKNRGEDLNFRILNTNYLSEQESLTFSYKFFDDDDWSLLDGKNPTVKFSKGLKPGVHTLQIKVCVMGEETIKSYEIDVEKHFYETKLGKWLLVIGGVGVVAGVTSFLGKMVGRRREQKEKIEKENLEREVEKRTKELLEISKKLKVVNSELKRYAEVNNVNHNAVLHIDPNNFYIKEWNDATLKMLGFSAEEMSDKTDKPFYYSYSDDLKEKIIGDLEKPSPFEFEVNVNIKKKSDSAVQDYKIIQVSMNPIKENDTIIDWIMIDTDVTEMMLQKQEIEDQKAELQVQKAKIEKTLQDLQSAMDAAVPIQKALLQSESEIDKVLGKDKWFIFHEQKEVIGGDFYFIEKLPDGREIIVVADATGHSIQGAFMAIMGGSKIGSMLKKGISSNYVLGELRKEVKKAYKYETARKEGFEMGVVIIDRKNKKIEFSGAKNDLYVIKQYKPEIIKIKGDRHPVGEYGLEMDFSNKLIDYEEGDSFYMFSDGCVDQFGGEKGEKLKYRKFRELILEINKKEMKERKNYLDEFMKKWMNGGDQIDDMIVVGFEV